MRVYIKCANASSERYFVHGTVLHGDKSCCFKTDLKSGNKNTFSLYLMTLHKSTKYMLIN